MQYSAPGTKRIKIKVNLIGHIQEIVGNKQFDVELDDCTVRGLIEKISMLYGLGLIELIFKQETQEFIFLVLLNGTDVDFLRGLDTPLKEGDRIDIIPPVAGGQGLAQR